MLCGAARSDPVVVPSAGLPRRLQRAPGSSPRLLGSSLPRLRVLPCKFSALDAPAGFGHTLPCSSRPKRQVPAAGNVPARGGAFGTQASVPTIPGSHRITGHSRRSRFAARLNSGVMRCCTKCSCSCCFGRSSASFAAGSGLQSPTPRPVTFPASSSALQVPSTRFSGRLRLHPTSQIPGKAPRARGW